VFTIGGGQASEDAVAVKEAKLEYSNRLMDVNVELSELICAGSRAPAHHDQGRGRSERVLRGNRLGHERAVRAQTRRSEV